MELRYYFIDSSLILLIILHVVLSAFIAFSMPAVKSVGQIYFFLNTFDSKLYPAKIHWSFHGEREQGCQASGLP